MPIPRAVQEQADRAEAAYQELLNTGRQPAQEQPPEDPPQVVEPPAEPAQPAPPATQAPEPDSWELKYRVLKGKYDSEVPRMAGEIRAMQAQIATLQASPPAPVVVDDAAQMTPEAVVERYGEDFATAVAAIVESRAGRQIADVASRVDGIAQNTAASRRSAFITELAGLVPNWQEIDRDDGFTAYLDEFDAQTGRMRREFFNEADGANDAARTASFFRDYSRTKRSQPPAPAAPTQKPVAPSVDHLIAPDSSKSTTVQPGKKVWSSAEINRFYKEARPYAGSKEYGLYTAAEFNAINSQIDAAVIEGRVR